MAGEDFVECQVYELLALMWGPAQVCSSNGYGMMLKCSGLRLQIPTIRKCPVPERVFAFCCCDNTMTKSNLWRKCLFPLISTFHHEARNLTFHHEVKSGG
jgi:hypothetical protein